MGLLPSGVPGAGARCPGMLVMFLGFFVQPAAAVTSTTLAIKSFKNLVHFMVFGGSAFNIIT